ncbi:MAG: GspH/FimT family pseudopilin [Pseudomonadota bacterium]
MDMRTQKSIRVSTQSVHGYTMLELMVVVGITAILAVMTVPGMQDSIERNAREASMQDITTAISLARSEAVAQGRSVSICRSTNQAACAAGAGGADWDDGWIIFSDSGTAGTLGSGDTLLQVHGPSNNQSKITLKNRTNGNFTGDFLQFNRDGFLNNSSTGAYFKFCDHDDVVAKTRAVWLSNTGRPAISTSETDGVHDDLVGANLACP